MNRTTCLLILSLNIINLLGCANPTIVETVQNGDYDMDCVELTMAIAEAKYFRKEAQSEKGMTGGNVTRAILLWPTILGTYSNANQATQAADTRIVHLSRINEEKCGHQPGENDEVLFWEKVKEKNTIVMYKVYLSVYPEGTFAEDAQSKLNELNMQKQDENIENKEGK